MIVDLNDKEFRKALETAINESNSFSEVVRKLGKSKTGPMVHKYTQIVLESGISIEHFRVRKQPVTRTNENVFVEHSTADQKTLKKFYKILFPEEICSICGIGNEWKGKHLEMILDHIDGVHDNDVITNLRYVCPNCNSQLETTSGRNIVYQRKRRQKNNCV